MTKNTRLGIPRRFNYDNVNAANVGEYLIGNPAKKSVLDSRLKLGYPRQKSWIIRVYFCSIFVDALNKSRVYHFGLIFFITCKKKRRLLDTLKYQSSREKRFYINKSIQNSEYFSLKNLICFLKLF